MRHKVLRDAINPCVSPLLTDLYELTMLQGYFDRGMDDTAVFEFSVRRLPSRRNFLMAAGLEQVLEFLESLSFSAEELRWIERSGRFRPDFVESLYLLRFTGNVDAMPEGTIFFADEPILRIVAPLPQAQLVESRLMNLLHFETLIASKASRSVLAARGKPLVDFGLRRAHGAEAGLLAARASYLAGFAGSSVSLAAPAFGIPIYGTMAHSFVESHDDELESFLAYARANPENVTLLIDTYDTEAGAWMAVKAARILAKEGIQIRGVRIDSGNLADHARKVRAILDKAGFPRITLFASGGLDEDLLQRLTRQGAPIDAYGVGTELVTSGDAPHLDCVYKLQEYARRERRKRSEGKSTWPGRKQVLRRYDSAGRFERDVLTVEGDFQKGEPLLVPVLRRGRRLAARPTLRDSREHARRQLERLPDRLRSLGPAEPYPVEISASLHSLAHTVDESFSADKTHSR